MDDGLVTRSIDLPTGPIAIQQPSESAELPDDGGVEWAPIAPYWSVLWRSGVELAREVATLSLSGNRIVELGCGLALPSLAAARAGADVLATDEDPEAVELAALNASANELRLEVARVDWSEPDSLLAHAPFDLVLAADVLYERASITPLLRLLPRLAPQVLLADPGRRPAEELIATASGAWRVARRQHGVVSVHRLRSR